MPSQKFQVRAVIMPKMRAQLFFRMVKNHDRIWAIFQSRREHFLPQEKKKGVSLLYGSIEGKQTHHCVRGH